MDKMYRIKHGAIIKVVPEGSLKWYKLAGLKVLGEVLPVSVLKTNVIKEDTKGKKVSKNATNKKKNARKRSNV